MNIKRYNLEPLVPASRGFQLKECDGGSLCYYVDTQEENNRLTNIAEAAQRLVDQVAILAALKDSGDLDVVFCVESGAGEKLDALMLAHRELHLALIGEPS